MISHPGTSGSAAGRSAEGEGVDEEEDRDSPDSQREPLAEYLTRQGFVVRQAEDAAKARSALLEEAPDLVLLDIMMPGEDGLSLCRHLAETKHLPVIMLTAKGEESDKILGLGLGADDYLTKPFSPGELIARVKAVLRRTQAAAPALPGDVVRIGGLRINPGGRVVERDGEFGGRGLVHR